MIDLVLKTENDVPETHLEAVAEQIVELSLRQLEHVSGGPSVMNY